MRILAIVLFSTGIFAQTAAEEAKHANVLKIVEIAGVKAAVQSELGDFVDRALAKLPQVSSRESKFIGEWRLRVHNRIDVDAFVAVAAKAYEANLSSEDVNEFLAWFQAQRDGRPVPFSSRLQQRIEQVQPIVGQQVEDVTNEMALQVGRAVAAEMMQESQRTGAGSPSKQR